MKSIRNLGWIPQEIGEESLFLESLSLTLFLLSNGVVEREMLKRGETLYFLVLLVIKCEVDFNDL